MKFTRFLLPACALILALSTTACQRNCDDVWEDSKSASRHMSRGIKTLGGKQGHSRAVQCRDDFMPIDDACYPSYDCNNDAEFEVPSLEFVPLSDQSHDDEIAMGDYVSRQPRESPGEPGSSIPGLEAFQDPSTNPALAGTFKNILFEYNSSLVKGQNNLQTLHNVADYLKRNRTTYIFVEGHCDERGPEAYNLALGARRSNAVRDSLIQEGVDKDRIFTICYGKERPLIHDHHEEAWNQNRRAEFKVYQR
jgi:peptidoglycan-associated lipoprotein